MDEETLLLIINIIWGLMGYYYGRADEKKNEHIYLVALIAVFLVMLTVKLIVK